MGYIVSNAAQEIASNRYGAVISGTDNEQFIFVQGDIGEVDDTFTIYDDSEPTEWNYKIIAVGYAADILEAE